MNEFDQRTECGFRRVSYRSVRIGCKVEPVGSGSKVSILSGPGPEIFLLPGPGPKVSDMMNFS